MHRRLSFAAALSLALLTLAPAAQAAETLKVWSFGEADNYTETMVKEFQAKNPEVKVEVRRVAFADVNDEALRAIRSGTGPDVMPIDNPNVAFFAAKKALYELDPLVAQSKVIDPAKFHAGPRANSTWNGKLVGVPRGANTIALYLNDDLFRAAGLDPDKPPQTWDQLLDAARKLNNPAKNVFGIAFSAKASEEGTFQFLPWVQSAGADWNQLGSPGAVRAVTFWQKLLDDKLASRDTLSRGQSDATATFINGNAAMVVSGPWEIPGIDKNARFKWRVALLPAETAGGARASALGEQSYVIPKTAANPKLAFRFLEYVVSQQGRNWNDFGILPATTDAAAAQPKWPAAYAVFSEQMKSARGRGPNPEWPQISKAIYTAMQQVLTHQGEPKAALDGAAAQIQRLAKR